jgi:hypothetical protein
MKFLVILLLLLVAAEAQATTYYGSASGSNTTCGAAQVVGTPATANFAFACASGGDTISLAAGTYANFRFDFSNNAKNGTSGSYTTVTSTSGTVTLQPQAGLSAFNFDNNASYVRVQNMTIDGLGTGNRSGVTMSTATPGAIHHIEFIGMTFHQTDGGNWITGYDGVLRNSIFTGTRNSADPGRNHDWYLGSRSQRWLIQGNHFSGASQGYCIHPYDGGLFPSTMDYFLIEHNYFSGCGSTQDQGAILIGGPSNIIRYNVFAANEHGIRQTQGGSSLVYNNTFYANTVAGITHIGSDMVARNNIFAGNAADIDRPVVAGSVTADHNLLAATAANHFVNAAGNDFSLISTSTAINAGTVSIGTLPISGLNTTFSVAYNGTLPDIGAHESLGAVTCVVANATPTLVDCTVENNVNPPVLPASSITGFTVTGKTLSSTTRAGTNGFQATVTVGFSAGTCAVSYAQTGNFTDSGLIGNTSNQELFAGAATCTNNVSGGAGATVTQSHVAMYEWTGNEGSGTQIGSTNSTTAMPVMLYGKYLGRIGLKTTVADTPATNYALYYSKNAAAYAVMPTYTGTQDTGICDAPAVSNGNTVQRITSGSYVAGRVVEVGAGVPTITMTSGQSTELLYPICFGPGAALGDNFKYRVYKDDGTALAYDTNATLNVDVVSPGLSGL